METEMKPAQPKVKKVGNYSVKPFAPRPMWSIGTLAQALGYSRRGARLFLESAGVPVTLVGPRYYVFLSDLITNAPELYASLCEFSTTEKLNKKTAKIAAVVTTENKENKS